MRVCVSLSLFSLSSWREEEERRLMMKLTVGASSRSGVSDGRFIGYSGRVQGGEEFGDWVCDFVGGD